MRRWPRDYMGAVRAPQAPTSLGPPGNVGRSTPVQLAAGLQAADVTQLVAVTYPEPRQLVVTMRQVSRVANPVTPWVATQGSPAFNGPDLSTTTVMRTRVRWGAGGVSFLAFFDYPLAGGVFGLTAESLSVDVTWWDYATASAAPPTFGSADIVPVVGAFLVEGVVADPSPLRYAEDLLALAASPAPASAAVLNVPPYARQLALASNSTNAITLEVAFQTGGGATIDAQRVTAPAGAGARVVLDVPSQACSVLVSNQDGVNAINVRPSWRIGLT